MPPGYSWGMTSVYRTLWVSPHWESVRWRPSYGKTWVCTWTAYEGEVGTVSFCLSLGLSTCLFLSLSPSLSLYVSLSSLCVSLSLYLCLSLSTFISLSLSISLYLSLSVFLPLSFYVTLGHRSSNSVKCFPQTLF